MRFFPENGKVHFEVNLDGLRRSRLKIIQTPQAGQDRPRIKQARKVMIPFLKYLSIRRKLLVLAMVTSTGACWSPLRRA